MLPHLFNGGIAFGALFRVGADPVGSLGIVLALFEPPLDQETDTRLMVRVTTAETEPVTTFANNSRNHTRELVLRDVTFDSVFAVWRRAPAEELVVVDVRPEEKVVVPEKGKRATSINRVSPKHLHSTEHNSSL